MGKIQQKMNGPILLIVTLVILGVMMYGNKNRIESQNKYFEENGLYTIGRVIEYRAHTGSGSSSYIRISYKVNGEEYEVESDYNAPFKNGPESGEMFMALYLPNEPKKCALLFDYPVKDSSDYKKYIYEFKKNPPKLK